MTLLLFKKEITKHENSPTSVAEVGEFWACPTRTTEGDPRGGPWQPGEFIYARCLGNTLVSPRSLPALVGI